MEAQLKTRPQLVLVAHGIHDDGGMERAFAELIRRVHDRYEIVVLSSDLDERLRDLVEWRRVPVPRRPVPLRFALFYLLGAARLGSTRQALVHTLGAIVPNAADVSTVQFCHAGFLDAAGRLAPPRAPRLRRLNTGIARVLALLAERWSYRRGRVDLLAPVSQGVARELRRHYPGVPLAVTPNGVDRDRFRPDAALRAEVRGSLAISSEDVVALFVGGDWDRKGLGIAIGALARARRTCESRVRLLVVGRGDVARFTAVAADLGVADGVRFLGPRRDAESFFAAADVFVFPTWYEAFPLVVLEAAAAGLPIVASAANGIEELLASGDAGMIVERSPEGVGAALARLADDPALRRRLGAAARGRSADYTWDRSVDAVEAIYRSLAASGPAARSVG